MQLIFFVLVWEQFSSPAFPATLQTKTQMQSRYKGRLTCPNILSKLPCAAGLANTELAIFFFSFTVEMACQQQISLTKKERIKTRSWAEFCQMSFQMTQLSVVQEPTLERVMEIFTAKLVQACTRTCAPHTTALLH